MITRSAASLTAYSDTRATSEVTRVLGLEPTRSHEIGDRHGSRGQFEHRHAAWILDIDADDPVLADDETGFASVRELVRIVGPVAHRFDALLADWELIVTWGGFSDSGQGGFVVEPEVLDGLARLRVPLYGTAYLDDPREG